MKTNWTSRTTLLFGALISFTGSAFAFDSLPTSFQLTKSGSFWSMSPSPNMSSGTQTNVIYGVNQSEYLSTTAIQYISFSATWSGQGGPNMFTDPTTVDHVVVGLNHRTFFDASGPTGNAFVGVTIGHAGPCNAGVTIEWKAPGFPDAFASSCYVPPNGTTSVSVSFSVSYLGCAYLDIYDGSGQHSISQCNFSMASPYAGAAVAAISGAPTWVHGLTLSIAGPTIIDNGGGGSGG